MKKIQNITGNLIDKLQGTENINKSEVIDPST